jgi:hypothetical protein
MSKPRSSRAVALGLVLAALTPAGALAGQDLRSPDARDLSTPAASQDLRSPDSRDVAPAAAAPALQWPNGPQPVVMRQAPATAAPASDGGGIETGVWIAIGGASLIAVGGVGFAGRKRVQVVRKRQVA